MKLHQVLKCPWNKRNFKGDLDLSCTEITELPDNLSVKGNLDLSGTEINSLPDNLSIGGYLYLGGTKIAELPENLKVGGGFISHRNSSNQLSHNSQLWKSQQVHLVNF